MIEIKEPFKTDIDVTADTPLCDIPASYSNGMRERLLAQVENDKVFISRLAELSVNPDIEQFWLKEIHRTVSAHDDHVITVAFHAALSAYNKPLNLALKAESGSGKSYSTTQTVLFFPQEDVFYIASQSPKVISHEHGTQKTADGRLLSEIPEPQKPDKNDYQHSSEYPAAYSQYIEEMKAYRELTVNSYYEVDLRNKVIVFLESINNETFKMIKTTMSHDNEENGFVDHKYVDDKGKVHKTRLLGAPTLIFNSLDNEYVAEFATRCLTATPSTSKEKIAAAMEISNRKSCFPWEYEKENLNRLLFQEYIRRIRDTMRKGKINVINPFLSVHEVFNKDQTRAMRDFNKYLELLAPFAMFKLFQRPVMVIAGKRYLVPTVQDALNAKSAFDAVLQTTQTGTEMRIISFYYDVVAKHPEGATAEDLTAEYNRERKKPLTVRRIRTYLNRLIEIEWLDEKEGEHENAKGYVDHRFKLYVPLKKCSNGAVLETNIDLKANLENSFRIWLKSITEMKSFSPLIIIPKIDGTAYQITLEEMEQIVLGGESENISALLSTPISLSIQENKAESVAETETNLLEHNSVNITETLQYRKLSPTERVQCDGEERGQQCPLMAEYEVSSSDNPLKLHYCPSHFKTSAKACTENGYALKEIAQ